jgi:HNH endonuclease
VGERLLLHIVVLDNGCWEWTGAQRRKGYGHMWVEGKDLSAHRLAFEASVGPIPAGYDIDHECHNEAAHLGLCDGGALTCRHTLCINPAHLRAVTRRENLLASPLTEASRLHKEVRE